jgi:hypothetical protein
MQEKNRPSQFGPSVHRKSRFLFTVCTLFTKIDINLSRAISDPCLTIALIISPTPVGNFLGNISADSGRSPPGENQCSLSAGNRIDGNKK